MKSSNLLSAYIEKKYFFRKLKNKFVIGSLFLSSFVVVGFLAFILGYLVYRGMPSLNKALFFEIPKPVGEANSGMGNSIFGSLILVGLASFIGIPLGLSTGIFLSEYGRGKWASCVRFSVDMMNSIPSIVIGLFVYVIVVKPMQSFSALAGGLALGIIMIPTVARTTEELLKVVPDHIREAGLALGIPRWKVILRIVVRGSLSGIMVGIIASIARIAGETAPLLFTALNNRFWAKGLDQPISSLPVQIYTFAIAPFESWNNQAWSGALVLVFFVLTLNILTRIVLTRREA